LKKATLILISLILFIEMYSQIKITDTIQFEGIMRMNLKTGEIKLSNDTINYSYNYRKINKSFARDTMWIVQPKDIITLFREQNIYIDSIFDSKLSYALLNYNHLMGSPITKDSTYILHKVNANFLRITLKKELLLPYPEYVKLVAFYKDAEFATIYSFY
jgi:hypothetical protein